MPLISICIPVYNAENYLEECLRPLTQMGNDVEIILSDDGSTDGSSDICRKYEEKYSNIIYIRGQNGGPSVARNRGLEKITGEYTVFCDADDWLEPQTCESIRRVVEEYNPDFIQFGLYNNIGEKCEELSLYYSKTRPMPESDYEDLFALTCGYRDHRKLPFPTYGLVTCKAYKTEKIKDIRFDPDIVGEDTYFALQAMKRMHKPVFLAEHLYNYRVVENSYSRKTYPGITEKAIRMLEETGRLLNINSNTDKKMANSYYYRCYDFLLWSIRASGFSDLKNFSEKVAYVKNICGNATFTNAIEKMQESNFSKKHRIFIILLRKKLWTQVTCILDHIMGMFGEFKSQIKKNKIINLLINKDGGK